MADSLGGSQHSWQVKLMLVALVGSNRNGHGLWAGLCLPVGRQKCSECYKRAGTCQFGRLTIIFSDNNLPTHNVQERKESYPSHSTSLIENRNEQLKHWLSKRGAGGGIET